MSIPLALSPVGYDTWVTELRRALITYLGSFDLVVDYLPNEKELVVHTNQITEDLYNGVPAIVATYIPEGVVLEQYNHSLDIPWRDWKIGYTQLAHLTNPYTSYVTGVSAYFDLGRYSYDVPNGDTLRIETEHCVPYDLGVFDFGPREGFTYNYGTFAMAFAGRIRPFEGYNADRVDVYNYCVIQDGSRHSTVGHDCGLYIEGETADKDWHVLKASISKEKVTFALDEKYTGPDWRKDGSGPVGYNLPFFVFGCPAISNIEAQPFFGRKKYLKFWLNDELKHHVIPALDKTGRPCMYDLVTKQTFYNAGSPEFIAGVETLAQLQTLVRNLPSTGGTLTISLPAAFETDTAAQAAIAAAEAKGWVLTKNYRTDEAT